MICPSGEAKSFRGPCTFWSFLSCGLTTSCKKATLSHPQEKIAESSPATILHCLGPPFQQPAKKVLDKNTTLFRVTWTKRTEAEQLRFFWLQVQTNKENDITHDDAIPASPNHLQLLLVLVLNSPCHSCSILKGQRLPVTWRAQIHHRAHSIAMAGASKTLRHAKDGNGEWIPSDRGGGRKDLNFRAFFPSVFFGWKRVEKGKKKTARDRMPSISSLRCCKGILCTGLRGQSLAGLHWTLVVKNSLFKLGTSSTQPSWLLPKGRHHHSAKSWVVEAELLQSGPMF